LSAIGSTDKHFAELADVLGHAPTDTIQQWVGLPSDTSLSGT
jgi:hypothetical protein